MKRAIAVPVVMWLCLMTACTDQNLTKVANGLNDTASAIGTLQATVIAANAQKLISDADTTVIMQITIKVNQAGKDAVAITRAISKLDKADAVKVLAILTPVIKTIGDLVDSGLTGIKDPATLAKIKGVLTTIQTTLNMIQLTLTGV